MRKVLVLVALVVTTQVVTGCGDEGDDPGGATGGAVAVPSATDGHPLGGVTTEEAELLCNKQYDEVVVPNTARRYLPLREVYVDGCVDEMTS